MIAELLDISYTDEIPRTTISIQVIARVSQPMQ